MPTFSSTNPNGLPSFWKSQNLHHRLPLPQNRLSPSQEPRQGPTRQNPQRPLHPPNRLTPSLRRLPLPRPTPQNPLRQPHLQPSQPNRNRLRRRIHPNRLLPQRPRSNRWKRNRFSLPRRPNRPRPNHSAENLPAVTPPLRWFPHFRIRSGFLETNGTRSGLIPCASRWGNTPASSCPPCLLGSGSQAPTAEPVGW